MQNHTFALAHTHVVAVLARGKVVPPLPVPREEEHLVADVLGRVGLQLCDGGAEVGPALGRGVEQSERFVELQSEVFLHSP